MSDLIRDFFERDLTPGESMELGRILENSAEEALRFAGLGEAAYLATGLPSHQWPAGHGGPFSSGGLAGRGPSLFAFGFAALGLGSLAAWWFGPRALLKASGPVPVRIGARSTPLSRTRVGPRPAQRAEPLPALPGLEGKKLDVLVEVPKESLVTVRVLDSGGSEVRLLYAGFLKPGRWSFTWDGLLSGGQAAPQGRYSIQVRSDRGTLSKNIDLTARP